MADLHFEHEESLTRAEAAKRLRALAKAVADGDEVELGSSGTRLTVAGPDKVSIEVEVEIEGEDSEVEIELKWSLPKRGGGASGKTTG